MNIRTLIADDHPILRTGLRDALGRKENLSVVGEAATAADAIKMTLELSPDVVVMDIGFPDMNGIEATRRIVNAAPAVKVVIFSSECNRSAVDQALEAGACGYLPKSISLDELMDAIGKVMEGKLYLSPAVSGGILEDYRAGLMQGQKGVQAGHPERDRRLLQLVARGARNKEIASELAISIKTVESNRSRLMKKLGCSSAAELVRYAVREGIVAA